MGVDANSRGQEDYRYLLGSVVTTGASFLWITIVYGLKIIPGVIWATLSGNLVAVIPSYYWNRAWAWGKRGRSHFRREIVPYWSMAFLGIAFSQLGAFWARPRCTRTSGVDSRTPASSRARTSRASPSFSS